MTMACACWGSWARIRACPSVLAASSSPRGQVWYDGMYLCSLTCEIPWEEWEAKCFSSCCLHCVCIVRRSSVHVNVSNQWWSVDDWPRSFRSHWLVNGGLFGFVFWQQQSLQSIDCLQNDPALARLLEGNHTLLECCPAVFTCLACNVCSGDAGDNSLWSLTLREVR